jgi:hypothetical protein
MKNAPNMTRQSERPIAIIRITSNDSPSVIADADTVELATSGVGAAGATPLVVEMSEPSQSCVALTDTHVVRLSQHTDAFDVAVQGGNVDVQTPRKQNSAPSQNKPFSQGRAVMKQLLSISLHKRVHSLVEPLQGLPVCSYNSMTIEGGSEQQYRVP